MIVELQIVRILVRNVTGTQTHFSHLSLAQCVLLIHKQELSYRKQIARQLRIQYVEGIHRPKYYTVTLKSRSRVTQGHWKWNHWTGHTRLTINRVI